MEENKTRKSEILNIVFSVLLFGGLWGIVEAKQWNFSKVKEIVYHPAFAGSMAAIALAVTLILH